MATSNCCSYVSSSSWLLRHRSSSVANVTQFPLLYPPYRGRLLAERFGLATIVVLRQNLSVSPPYAAVEARISGKREPMTPPYNVLITGSTKGIGYALAREFLKAGDNVVICSRSGIPFVCLLQGSHAIPFNHPNRLYGMDPYFYATWIRHMSTVY